MMYCKNTTYSTKNSDTTQPTQMGKRCYIHKKINKYTTVST